MRMERLVEGVYQLGTGMVNSYVIDGDEGVTLVDALVRGREGAIAQKLKEIGRTLADVSAILLTHSHMDHTGSAAAVKAASKARLYASEADAPAIQGTMKPPTPPTHWYYRPMFWLAVFFPDAPPVDVDHFVSEDLKEVLPGDLRAIDTPGHTPGHTSYLLDRDGGVLLVGDAAIATKDGRVKRGYSNRSTPEVDGSLRHLAEFEFEIAAFCHSKPIHTQASGAFRRFAESLTSQMTALKGRVSGGEWIGSLAGSWPVDAVVSARQRLPVGMGAGLRGVMPLSELASRAVSDPLAPPARSDGSGI